MESVSERKRGRKPRKSDQFTRHQRGYWCKRIGRKLYYFGKICDDPDATLASQKLADELVYLKAGRTPPSRLDGYTVEDAADDFTTAKEEQVASGELSPRTLADYKSVGQLLIDQLGADRTVASLESDDFAELRRSLSRKCGLVRLAKTIQIIRSIFKLAADEDRIDKAVKFGVGFKKPSNASLAKARQAKVAKHGKRMFEPRETHKLLGLAHTQFRAMIFLGLNCGYGNTDCATLPKSAIDWRKGWIEFPRPKTAVERRCPLWPETLAALKFAQAKRPAAAKPEFDHLVFLTKNGVPWVNNSLEKPDNAISKTMAKLLAKAKIKRPNLNFYGLRHTLQTIGGNARDEVALAAIMGHKDSSMAGHYREGAIDDARLRAVVNVVHDWLYGKAGCDFARGRL